MTETYKIHRYALPTGHQPLLDADGFLLPPADGAWLANSELPVLITALPKNNNTFVLLAAGGAGKTRSFRELADREQNADLVNAAPLNRDGLERKLAAARSRQQPTYVDGLDQAVLHDPRLLQWLEDELTTDAARLVPWRLACRSAAWESSLSHALTSALPDFHEWTLLPLDRANAELLVSARGYDGAAFIATVVDAGLGRLSACTGQLLTTAKFWSDKRHLPAGSVEAMQFEIDKFLAEPNANVVPTMPADQARRIAKRLGAFAAFSGAQSLSLVPHQQDDATLSVDALPSTPEPEQLSSPISPDDYRNVLRSALFEAASPGLVAFRHQMYVEYLAAAFLVDRRATPGQVAALLGTNTNGVLPFSRVGVAAWLAALKPALVEQLIADNVETFAFSSATVEMSSDSARAAVVEALLNAADTGDLRPRWGLDLSGLAHPTMDEQLSRRLPADPAASQLLWWLARLAIAGHSESLADTFAHAAGNTSYEDYARRQAILAADELGDDTVRHSLRLVLEEDLADPHNEVLSTLIEVLYPRLLTTADLAEALRPHRTGLIGNYRRKLRVLADEIPDAELATFISGFTASVDDDDESDMLQDYYELPIRLIRRAWPHADDPTLRRALAELVHLSVHTHHWHQARPTMPWMDGPTTRRRALALELAAIAEQDWYGVVVTGLIQAVDVAWLIEQLPTLPPQAASLLSTCLTAVIQTPTREHAELILELPPQHPAFESTSHFRGATQLDSPEVARCREIAALEHTYEQELVDQRFRTQSAIAELFDKLDDTPTLWWRLTYLLAGDNGDTVFDEDLTARPGWQHLTEVQRVKLLQSGIQYLRVHKPNPQQWCRSTQLTVDIALPDWEGVRLLSTLARYAPDTFTPQNNSIWDDWSHAVVATWVTHTSNTNEPTRLSLLRLGLKVAPGPITEAALRHLDDLDAAGNGLTPHPVYRCLASHIASEVAKRLLDNQYHGDLAHDVLSLVAEHGDPATALDTCLQLRARNHPELANRARTHLARIAPDTVIAEFDSAPPTAAAVARLAAHLDPTKLDHAHLVRAASILLDTYPYAEDKPLQTGFAYTPEHHAQDLRGRLLQQLADNGHANDLEALLQGRSELDRNIITISYLRTARSRQAELTLSPTTPEDLLELLRSTDARLVHSDADLVNVVLRILEKLQHALQNGGAFKDIWNGTVPQSEDDISDWIRRWCEELSSSGIVVNRELQVVRNSAKGGIGTRIDLAAESRSPAGQDAFVVVEAKRLDNRDLLTSMSHQLVERYLKPLGHSHGIYLAYWIQPDQRPRNWSRSAHPTAADLLHVLQQQADDERARGMQITPYVLDISQQA